MGRYSMYLRYPITICLALALIGLVLAFTCAAPPDAKSALALRPVLHSSQSEGGAGSTVEIPIPSYGETVSGVTLVKVKVTDPVGITDINLYAGKYGEAYKYFTTPYPTTYTMVYDWDTTQEKNGFVKLIVECNNSNSEHTSYYHYANIQNIKGPSIAWVSPASGQIFKDTVSSTTVKAGITKGEGDTGITKVQFLVDNKVKETKSFNPAVNSLTYTYTLDLSSLSLGKHTLKIHAENTSGGKTDSTRTFYRYSQPPGEHTWYLAEGTTDWGFTTYITVQNPNASPANVKFTYMTAGGPVDGGTMTMPEASQLTVNPIATLGIKDFSTRVECLEGMQIAVDRTMTWNAGAGEEGHNSVGVTAPAKTWYLPEGSSKWGFECWLLIQNPNSQAANCTITYMIEGEGPREVPVTVPPSSRATHSMADHIGAKDASIKVTSDQPVIPERAMYRNNRRGGHDSIGTTTPSTDYYLAEGTTGYGFTTYVLIQNPGAQVADIDVTYMTGSGPVAVPTFQMPPQSRKTINVNETIGLPDPNFSTHVKGSQPIIAERAMYWDNGTGEACHDSIGMSAPHATFYLPDGENSNIETWTLVQNPNGTPVDVEITYMTYDGKGNKSLTDNIPPNTRKTYFMADAIYGSAAIMVQSKTPDKKIMVERAMYWNNRGAGTDTIGGYSD